uniref:Uncharacterized protein n=1 Tax=Arundo donax TaxID=35708 RepID=A0A0A9BH98_ARUDO
MASYPMLEKYFQNLFMKILCILYSPVLKLCYILPTNKINHTNHQSIYLAYGVLSYIVPQILSSKYNMCEEKKDKFH